MNQYKYIKNIFNKINIEHDNNLLLNIISDNYYFFAKYTPKKIAQYGGNNNIIKYKYDKYTFIIYKDEDDYNINFSIHNENNIEEPKICAHIMIPKEENFAYIQTIGNYPKCTLEGLPKTQGGSIILSGMLSFINSIKNKYKLKYIQLKDNSYFFCKSNKKNIPLSTLYMLTRGSTWYHKYGFNPYDNKTKGIDIDNMVKLKTNQNLVNKIRLSCTNIENIIMEEFIKKFDKKSIETLKKVFIKYKNESVVKFMKVFMSDFDNTCEIFYNIYEKIINDLGLSNLYGISYYKIL
jgi:hypothetical protein